MNFKYRQKYTKLHTLLVKLLGSRTEETKGFLKHNRRRCLMYTEYYYWKRVFLFTEILRNIPRT